MSRLWHLLALSTLHFAAWASLSVVAYGTDLDHLPSRSALAQYAASLSTVLQFPHDWFVVQFASPWLQIAPALAIALIVANSLLWGVFLRLVLRVVSYARQPGLRPHH